MKTHWLCWLIGHKPDLYPWDGPFRCLRCDSEGYDDPWHVEAISRLYDWYWWRWRPGAWVDWFGRCPGCGKRFWRHDDHKSQMPF